MKFFKVSLLATVGAALFLVGCSAQSQPQTPSTPQVAIDKSDPGYQLFAKTCAGCHGADLQGISGPNLTHVGTQMTEAQIETQILNGGGFMPGFKGKLNSQQVTTLAQFLSKLK